MAEEKEFVYLLDNCPHDWLFLQCASVVSFAFFYSGFLSFPATIILSYYIVQKRDDDCLCSRFFYMQYVITEPSEN